MRKDGAMSGKDVDAIGASEKMDEEMIQTCICAPPLTAEKDTETDDRIAIYFTFDGQVDTYLLRKDLPKPIIKIFTLLQLQNTAK